MRFRLRTLMIAVTLAGMTCAYWMMALDSARKGQVNITQLLVIVLAWAFGIFMLVPRR
jgi:hypothetical protein